MRCVSNETIKDYESLFPNTTTQLGWHPPLEVTKQDMIAEEVFEKNGEKLPIGFFICALKMGRVLRMVILEKANQDLSSELGIVQHLLSDLENTNEGGRKLQEATKYKDFLYNDLDVINSAINNYGRAADAFLFEPPNSLTTSSQENRDPVPYEQVSTDLSLTTVTPHPHDVLLGRGSAVSKHIGNVNWYILVATNKSLYSTLQRRQKTLLSRSIVIAVRNQNPPGRFLQKDPTSDLWIDVGIQRATEKTSQALRDAPAQIAPTHHLQPRRPRPIIVRPDGRFYPTNKVARVV